MRIGEWTLRSRCVVTPSGTRAADVLIRQETIVDVLDYEAQETEGVILDAGEFAVLPGLVALHRESPEIPGVSTFESSTRDSAAGGVTTLVDLPPRLGNGAATASVSIGRMAAAGGMIRVDCGLIVPLGRGEVNRIEAWIEAGFLGVEAVLEGEDGEADRSATSASDLPIAMPILATLGRPLLVDLGRDSIARSGLEPTIVRFLLRLCRETSCRVHLVRPSMAESLAMIAEAYAEGLALSAETCPRYLGREPRPRDGDGPNPNPNPNPPDELDQPSPDAQARLWGGLAAGWISGIGPDQRRSTAVSPDVATDSIRSTLPTAWANARRRGSTLDQVARWMAEGSAATLGLAGRKGSIAPGLDADFVIFNPDAREGPPACLGRVEATILRGTLIYEDGRFFDHHRGSIVLRVQETQPFQGSNA